jgi:hypothetical protein
LSWGLPAMVVRPECSRPRRCRTGSQGSPS